MKNYRKQQYLNVNGDLFIQSATPQHAYILGLRWADSTIISKYKKKELRFEMKEDDINSIRHIFDATGNWSESRRVRKNRSPQIVLSCNNAKLVDYLIDNDYGIKSRVSPIKIINSYDEKHIKYFIRGWIDGDGCFYHNKKHGLNQFYLSGTYEQNWDAIEEFLNLHTIQYKIIRVVSRNGNKYSNVRVTGIKNIIKIYNAIYDSDTDTICMPRKLLKCLEIINQ